MLGMVAMDCVSGVLDLSMLRKLPPMLKEPSLASLSCPLSESMVVAREADLGLPELANNPFSAETALVGDTGLGAVV
jgi:hypothetical protein